MLSGVQEPTNSEEVMQIEIKVDNAYEIVLTWPEGLDLPTVGDLVQVETIDGPVTVIVDRRFFGIGKQGLGNNYTQVQIHGHVESRSD